MGRKKGSKKADSDDALLDAAIAQVTQEREAASAKAAAAQRAAAKQGLQEKFEPQLTVKDLVSRLDVIPTFAVMSEVRGQKRFMPMQFSEDSASAESLKSGTAARQVCAFFLDPTEAKRTLLQAQAACPDKQLVLGAMPLGHAFSLCVGWADAVGDTPFTIRGAAQLTRDTRQHLVEQLEGAGLPAYWQLPVILCEDLHNAAALPVFFSHESLAVTWTAAGHAGPPPTRLHILDLRLLTKDMLRPYNESRTDWTVVRFLGLEGGAKALQGAFAQLDAAGGLGSGKGSGDAAPMAEQARQMAEAARAAALRVDPEMEPPALVS